MKNRNPERVFLLGLAFAALVVSAGCSKETKPVAEDPKAPSASEEPAQAENPAAEETPSPAAQAPPAAAGTDATPSGSKVSEASYDLVMEPEGEYEAGKAATVNVVLEAKSPFKINQEYPYSFALQQSEGVTFASMKVKQDAIKLEQKRAVMAVPFTPASAGEKKIAGTFKFSVCTEEQCLIKKADLSLAVQVK